MSFKEDFSEFLVETGTVYSKSKASAPNDFGEKSFSLSEDVANLQCVRMPVREKLEHNLYGTTYVVTDIVYCEYREDINPGDYIEIDSTNYLITAALNPGGQSHHLKLFVTGAQ